MWLDCLGMVLLFRWVFLIADSRGHSSLLNATERPGKPAKTFTLPTKSYKAAYITFFPVISEHLIINTTAVLALGLEQANSPGLQLERHSSPCIKEDAAALRNAGQALCCSGVWGSGSVTLFGLCPHWQSVSFPIGLPRPWDRPLEGTQRMLPREAASRAALTRFACVKRAAGTCWLCSAPCCNFHDNHLISTKLVVAEI